MLQDMAVGAVAGVAVWFLFAVITWVCELCNTETTTKIYFRLLCVTFLCSSFLGSCVGYKTYLYEQLLNKVYINTISEMEEQAANSETGFAIFNNDVINEYVLNHCPVCGEHDFEVIYDPFGATNDWVVRCNNCRTQVVAEDGTVDEAIQKWNSLDNN